MIEEIRLPEISENVDTGDVIAVLVHTGDVVEKEQSIVELETEKAAFEVPSPIKGKVTEINIKAGDQVKVGQVMLKVDSDAQAQTGQAPERPDQSASARTEASPAPQESQRPQEHGAEEKQTPVGEPPERQSQPVPGQEASTRPDEVVAAAPSVRQLARELGINIHEVTPSDESGRITADDVKAYARRIISGRSGQAMPTETRALPDVTRWGAVERQSISVTRKKIADTLSYTWSHVPQVTQYDRADITGLDAARRTYAQAHKKRVTVTSIAVKVAALALKTFPKFNASFDARSREIIYKKFVHISVAVETDRGLLVPVLRDVDRKSLRYIAEELDDLAQRTRQHQVTPDDMVGGNFTVSNLGGIGGTDFAPIIYWPQVAILGMGRAAWEPGYHEGQIQPRLRLPLSLSYDHRIIDGAEGLQFLRWIAERLEKPFLLALEQDL